MKKLFVLLLVALFPLVWLLAVTVEAENAEELEVKMEALGEKLEAMGEEIEMKVEKLGDDQVITINTLTATSGDRAYLGVYYEDLTLKKVRALNYPYNYGVLITGTGAGSAAHQHGLAADDILMSIDGKKCTDKDKFVKIVASYMPDQTVPIKIFSNEVEKEISFTFGRKPEKKTIITKKGGDSTKKKKTSYPHVEFMYTPYWYMMDDIDDLNHVMNNMEFNNLDEDGMLYNGFAARANVGKGFYIGGMGAGYHINRKVGHTVTTTGQTDPTQPHDYMKGSKDFNVTRRMKFSSGWGGVTLDKKFMLGKWVQPALGVVLGAGSQTIKFTQTNGEYDWTDLNTQFDSDSNNAMEMKRSFFIVQPRVELYVGILSWLGIRAEGAYMIGYSSKPGWTETSGNFIIDNSPETTMNGYAFTVGPWVQF